MKNGYDKDLDAARKRRARAMQSEEKKQEDKERNRMYVKKCREKMSRQKKTAFEIASS